MPNQSPPLYKPADKIDWAKFDTAFVPPYCMNNGRPAKPVRLMYGLLIFKNLRNLSDEIIVEKWCESTYYQCFCGMQEFIYGAPVPLPNWFTFAIALGKRGIELIFQESIRVNNEGDDDEYHDVAFIDSTVQEKNITNPTDEKLHKKIVRKVWDIVHKLELLFQKQCLISFSIAPDYICNSVRLFSAQAIATKPIVEYH